MKLFANTFAWLSDGANWRGHEGLWHLLVQQLLLTFTALGIVMVFALPVALWLGHLGRGGLLAINVDGGGRAEPTLAVRALLVMFAPTGTATPGPPSRARTDPPKHRR